MKKLINNAVKPGKDHECLTLRAEKTVKKHLEAMVKELCTLKNVEYFDFDLKTGDDEGCGAGEFNCDTAFREAFHQVIEDEIYALIRKYG